MIQTQEGTKCGVHAISNLLQKDLDKKYLDFLYVDPKINSEEKETIVGNLLSLKKEAEQESLRKELEQILDKLLSQPIGTCKQDGSMLSIDEVKSLLFFTIDDKELEIRNALFTDISKDQDRIVGFIENNQKRTHYTAWILKDGFWYNIDSINTINELPNYGTITKYNEKQAEELFKQRDKIPNSFETVFLLRKSNP